MITLGIGNVFEPNTIVYSLDTSLMDQASKNLERLLEPGLRDEKLVKRVEDLRIFRVNLTNKTVKLTVRELKSCPC